MKIHKELSYGVVPMFKKTGTWYVLLIYQASQHNSQPQFWTFPKGHPERGESATITSLRELEEETGLTSVILDEQQIFSISYTFILNEIHVDKQVDYYIGYCTTQNTVITQPNEVLELRWCTIEDAQELLIHENIKRLLNEIMQCLR
jgi:bis(5'-nucleosidyl)-tetraphosphatase